MRASTVAVFVAFCALTAADGDTGVFSSLVFTPVCNMRFGAVVQLLLFASRACHTLFLFLCFCCCLLLCVCGCLVVCVCATGTPFLHVVVAPIAVFVSFSVTSILNSRCSTPAALSGGDSSSSDSSDSSDSVPFHRIKTCQECVESGFGWCPIRRACGGFQNRNCIGDNDERDFARARVEVVTDADMQFPPFTSTQLNRVFLVYDSSATEKALSACCPHATRVAAGGVVGV